MYQAFLKGWEFFIHLFPNPLLFAFFFLIFNIKFLKRWFLKQRKPPKKPPATLFIPDWKLKYFSNRVLLCSENLWNRPAEARQWILHVWSTCPFLLFPFQAYPLFTLANSFMLMYHTHESLDCLYYAISQCIWRITCFICL